LSKRSVLDVGEPNDGFEYREILGSDCAGQTVLDYLSRRYSHTTPSVWRERLAAGRVLFDGTAADAALVLEPGLSLVWRRPPWIEPRAPCTFALVYRDAHLLAVAKPRDLPTLPGGGFLTHTLLHVVRTRWPEAAPLHRLGRGTSGLVLCSRTPQARRGATRAWTERRVEKHYRALVTGVPARSAFRIEDPIGRVPHPRLGDVYAVSAGGKAALTEVRVLASANGRSIVEARIPTGRPHQIRIHLAAAGHPLVGDSLYISGGVPGEHPGLPGDTGYWLHSHRLRLDHPITGRRLELECMPPSVLRVGSGCEGLGF
jgi:23S rRNA pseudouridine1911/1915/1917 synthase